MIAAAFSGFGFELSQSEYKVFSQNQQWPQLMVKETTTRSPFLMFLTEAPTSSTIPMGSCPMMSPAFIMAIKPSYR